MSVKTITSKKAEWLQTKGRIIAQFGSLTACAAVVGCAPQSLRACVLFGLMPGVRKKLDAALDRPLVRKAA